MRTKSDDHSLSFMLFWDTTDKGIKNNNNSPKQQTNLLTFVHLFFHSLLNHSHVSSFSSPHSTLLPSPPLGFSATSLSSIHHTIFLVFPHS